MSDSVIKYVGVDGCKAGWIGIGLADDGYPKVAVCEDISDIVASFKDACVILVDIPIGLPEDGKPIFRVCDKEARGLLGKRLNAVFLVPSRRFANEALENEDWGYRKSEEMKYAERHRKASKWSQDRYGKGIAAQAFGITRKIGEMDEYLPKHLGADSPMPTIREVHPEICFWALNGGNTDSAMATSKKKPLGFGERLDVLRHRAQDFNCVDVDAIIKKVRDKFTRSQVADDDILDALAAAITARIGCQEGNELRTLPENPPTDSKGLPMEMVYAKPNDTESESGSEK